MTAVALIASFLWTVFEYVWTFGFCFVFLLVLHLLSRLDWYRYRGRYRGYGRR